MSQPEREEERDEAELTAARQKVYDVFNLLGIPYEATLHPPIFSAADEVRKDIKIDALICKNLFLRNKDKSRYYLFTLPLDKRADLVALQAALGETRLSFGGADALWEHLHIRPGSVSLLNIIGAADKPSLHFLVDIEVLKVPRIGVHPNDNGATIVFDPKHLTQIFEHYSAEFVFIEI